jgi:hypothetical protein
LQLRPLGGVLRTTPCAAFCSLLSLALTGAFACAQDVTRVSDVIYAKHDGVALTMDVFTPAKPNGAAIIKIISGGWNSNHNGISDGGWTKHGFTTFVVVHGTQPRFHIDEIVADLQALRPLRPRQRRQVRHRPEQDRRHRRQRRRPPQPDARHRACSRPTRSPRTPSNT